MAKVRLGFVGVGNMGQAAHLVQYASLADECEVVALAELREDLGRKVAARWGVPSVYRDHRDMLAKEKLDGIVAIQPFHLHGAALKEVLAAGVPVLVEKPIGRSIAMGETLAAAADASGAKLYIAYHKRSDPAAIQTRQLIAQWQQANTYGKMKLVRMSMPPGDWVASGFWQLLKAEAAYPKIAADAPEYADKAADDKYLWFVNYYIHQINLMRFLLGEDYVVKYADPACVVLVGNAASGVTIVLEMASYSTSIDWQEEALVTFEKAWLKLRLFSPLTINRAGELTAYEDAGNGVQPRETHFVQPHLHAMRNQAMQFIKAIRGEATTLCTPRDAIADMKSARQFIDLLLAAK